MEREKWPRVTEVIDLLGLGPDFSKIPERRLEEARQRGNEVHEGMEALIYSFYEPGSLPLFAEYEKSGRAFLTEWKFEIVAGELEVRHDKFFYVGHLDAAGLVTPPGESTMRAIIDWKTPKSLNETTVGLQLTAYFEAYNLMYPNEPASAAFTVQLRNDGQYTPKRVRVDHWRNKWYAALTVHHMKGGLYGDGRF